MKIIKYFLQFLFIIIFFSLFKILGLNISSALGGKLFEKIGFIHEGTFRKSSGPHLFGPDLC